VDARALVERWGRVGGGAAHCALPSRALEVTAQALGELLASLRLPHPMHELLALDRADLGLVQGLLDLPAAAHVAGLEATV
jgi:hypothetical protein